MAELTVLEEKLAEVTGLAMAAKDSAKKVRQLTRGESDDLVETLDRMAREAAETQERCTQVASGFSGKKSAILSEAREVRQKATDMRDTYLDEDADALDGFEFLTMAEAAEVGHWGVLDVLSSGAQEQELAALVKWALPLQERHLETALAGAKTLAAEEDPFEAA
jgi:hypothetical protein